jgi:hypothetical protein
MALTTAHFVCRGSRRLTISFGSYILGIGRGYRDTRRSRLRIMGKPVLPLLAGLALLHSSLLRSSSIVPLHRAMHIRHTNNRGLMV